MSEKQNGDRNPFGAITAVAHELRTPLTAIQGALEILRDETAGSLSPTQREFVDLAHRNLARLKDRIEDALDIASLQGGSLLDSASVDLDELAECVAKRAAVELGPEVPLRFVGFAGERPLAMESRSLCRTLASVVATVSRHLGPGGVLVQASVDGDGIRFEVGADDAGPAGREYQTIHDASLAMACEMVEIHGGSMSKSPSGCCGVYVVLPLRPICRQGEPK